jgi:hypothetical protein
MTESLDQRVLQNKINKPPLGRNGTAKQTKEENSTRKRHLKTKSNPDIMTRSLK